MWCVTSSPRLSRFSAPEPRLLWMRDTLVKCVQFTPRRDWWDFLIIVVLLFLGGRARGSPLTAGRFLLENPS
jgi:hypothetical protein